MRQFLVARVQKAERESIMTSFVHITYPTEHPGVARFEAGFAVIRQAFSGTKGPTAMVLAAVVSALLVVADQMIDTWADGHLLAAWVTLWVVAFAALALLAPMVRRLTLGSVTALNAWAHRVARARADERMWALAQKDHRVLADIQAAVTRAESNSMVSDSARRVVQRQTASRVARLTRRIWND